MRKITFSLLIFLICSCTPLRERVFAEIQRIDFPTEVAYSISDARSSIYYIDYRDNRYMGWMHPDSVSFSKLRRFYSEAERDSLGLEEGKDLLVEMLPLGTPLALDLAQMCIAFRSVWQIDYKKIYLQKLIVDNTRAVWLQIYWKKTKQKYLLVISNDMKKALNASREYDCEENFTRINATLFYRKITEGSD